MPNGVVIIIVCFVTMIPWMVRSILQYTFWCYNNNIASYAQELPKQSFESAFDKASEFFFIKVKI
jgi:hypothetical protein